MNQCEQHDLLIQRFQTGDERMAAIETKIDSQGLDLLAIRNVIVGDLKSPSPGIRETIREHDHRIGRIESDRDLNRGRWWSTKQMLLRMILGPVIASLITAIVTAIIVMAK